ncbi:MAG: recombination mediator RecR [Ignavibacteriaceae bacterium]
MNIAEPLQRAIEEFSKFPGIGKKTAQRLSLFLLKADEENFYNFINSITDLKKKLTFCSRCYNISEEEICEICSSQKRDKAIICVVEEASDIIAIERTNEYSGLYHVLGGVLSPLAGMTHDKLKIKELLTRLRDENIEEIILALNPDTEGDATSLYLVNLLKPLGMKISRIARGLPIGGDLEFADEATIGRALLGRISL